MILAVTESEGIRSDLIPKIATGFCGGVSRTCGMCGAVSGGIMAIGVFSGRNAPRESVTDSYGMVRKLVEDFGSQFGSTNCKELTGCDLGTDEGQKYFKENNIKRRCRIFTEQATRISMGLIKQKVRSS